MSRGFDDMNHFVLTTSSLRHCLPPAGSTDVSNALPRAMGMFADHRAHWFRSSAVLLHYHKYVLNRFLFSLQGRGNSVAI